MEENLDVNFLNKLKYYKDQLPFKVTNDMTYDDLDTKLSKYNKYFYVWVNKDKNNHYYATYGIDHQLYNTRLFTTKKEAFERGVIEFLDSIYPYDYTYYC